MDTVSFIWRKEIYGNVAQYIKKRFDSLNYDAQKLLSIGKQVIDLMKDKLGKSIMKEFWMNCTVEITLRLKM